MPNDTYKKTIIRTIFSWLILLIAIAACLSVAYAGFQMFEVNLLPLRYRFIVLGVMGLLALIALVLAIYYVKKNRGKHWVLLFVLLPLIFIFAADYYLYSTLNAIDTIAVTEEETASEEAVSVGIAVLKEHNYTDASINGMTISAPYDADPSVRPYISLLQNDGYSPTIESGDSYAALAEKLVNYQISGFVFNTSFMKTMEELVPGFEEEVVILHPLSVKLSSFADASQVEVSQEDPTFESSDFSEEVIGSSEVEISEETSSSSVDVTEVESQEVSEDVSSSNSRGFNVFISGIDTYGSIGSVSRSDVNIIASVNPVTHKVLLTSVPRDSYVRIAGRGNWKYDKLTHAGNYGIKASMDTLANLFDTKIDYYVRLNFTSFLRIIDTIGGVTVQNPRSFTSRGGEYFPKGSVYLSGSRALAFVRERYNLSDGDTGRQGNQEIVIQAVFNKLIGPSMITNFHSILNTLMASVQTNMPKTLIMEMVNQQIDNGSAWGFSSAIVNGTGKTGLPSYAMPGWKLYMYVLSDSSVQSIRSKILQTIQ